MHVKNGKICEKATTEFLLLLINFFTWIICYSLNEIWILKKTVEGRNCKYDFYNVCTAAIEINS